MMTRRIVVCGAPRTGKSTLAGATAHHLDQFNHLPWSEQSEAAVALLERPGPWVIEGCAAVRALRKWLERHPEGKPCDLVIRLTGPLETHSPGQAKLAKGEATIWREVEPLLLERGVTFGYNLERGVTYK